MSGVGWDDGVGGEFGVEGDVDFDVFVYGLVVGVEDWVEGVLVEF